MVLNLVDIIGVADMAIQAIFWIALLLERLEKMRLISNTQCRSYAWVGGEEPIQVFASVFVKTKRHISISVRTIWIELTIVFLHPSLVGAISRRHCGIHNTPLYEISDWIMRLAQ